MRIAFRLLPTVLLLTCGCTDATVVGDKVTFTFSLWVGATVFLVALAAIAGSFAWMVLRDTIQGGVALTIALVIALVVVPGMFLDFCDVSQQGFHLRTGFWFAPAEHRVQFSDVVSMQQVVGRSGRRSTSFLVFQTRNGEQRVPVGDLMRNGPAGEIFQQLRRRGIPASL